MFNDNNFFSGGAAAAGFYDHPIEQSLRLNDDDSAYLSWTPASAGNRKTWTWSGWVKRGNIDINYPVLFGCFVNSTNYLVFRFDDTTDILTVIDKNAGTNNLVLQTNSVYRDTSSWYHIVLSVDTTQATSSDRAKLYVNGEQVTSFSTATYPSQNFDTYVNSANQHNIGSSTPISSTQLFDGYLAEVHFIDGTALDASSFGETKSGVWIPKAYAGSYGTNGFYLDGQVSENHEFDQGRAYSDALSTWRCSGNNIDYYKSFNTAASGSFKLKVYVDTNSSSYAQHKLQYQVNGGGWNDLYSGTSADPYNYTSGAISGTGTVEVRMCVYRSSGSADANVHTIKVWYFPDSSDTDLYAFDQSGNGNNFDLNNIVLTDVVLDSPTNNFCTLNPIWQGSANQGAPSEGNLQANSSGEISTFEIPKYGKWYWEVDVKNANGYTGIGFTNYAYSQYLRWNVSYGSWTNASAGTLNASNQTAYTNCTVMLAFDYDNQKFYMGVNGTWFDSGNPSAGTGSTLDLSASSTDMWFAEHNLYNGGTMVYNFGQDSSFAGNKTAQGNTDDNGYGDFYYAPPTGYLALCTANLEVPDAMNPALDASPQDYFNTVLYSGNSSTQSITGVGFQPDWIWLKNRTQAHDHYIVDSIRGANGILSSSLTNADPAYTPDEFSSFDSDGFTVSFTGGGGRTNYTGNAYAAWNWKANGSGVSNTDGSITSTVSANTDAGFSIIEWTHNGSTETIGHGLSQAPEFIVTKPASATGNWLCYSKELGNNQGIYLNQTSAAISASNWSNTDPTSSVFTFYTSSTARFISYCFHSVEGFSKFGSYTGNGSTDGTFVYTGFKPAFVMVKGTSYDIPWELFDTDRTAYNGVGVYIRPNSSSAELDYTGTYPNPDFLSNGFKWRSIGGGTNDTGHTYIYMAFAENPFKYSTAR